MTGLAAMDVPGESMLSAMEKTLTTELSSESAERVEMLEERLRRNGGWRMLVAETLRMLMSCVSVEEQFWAEATSLRRAVMRRSCSAAFSAISTSCSLRCSLRVWQASRSSA